MQQLQQKLKVHTKVPYEERRQAAFDLLNETYEEGIPLCPGEFRINHLIATMMARSAFREEYGPLAPKRIHIPADELPGTEVHPGIFIVRHEKARYFLRYENSAVMEEFIQMWVC
jgi:hypothetical protein